ncbi:MAG TPA: NUDIX domain-containing protein [Nitrososphaerales archaeon]|nr:NUDIX domain-containing protein [Nitrososphaerales archaeon]
MRSSREYPAHPLVGVGALIHDGDGRVLLIKRRFEPNEGRWSLPGGLLETGERLEQAARREVREELGVEVKIERLFQVSEEIIGDESGKTRFHFVLVDYLAALERPWEKITLSEESEGFEWFDPPAIEEMDVSENTKVIVRMYLAGRAGSQSGH